MCKRQSFPLCWKEGMCLSSLKQEQVQNNILHTLIQWSTNIHVYLHCFYGMRQLAVITVYEGSKKPLRWLPTVLTVSTPEEVRRTKNEVFVSTLGLSSWVSHWRLATHLGFLFRSYEYIADCCHGNKQSQR